MGLGTVELVMEFEDEFELTIPDDEAERIETVGQAVDYIEAVLRLRARPSRNDPCPSARQFREVRKGLQSWFNVPRQTIRPAARIGELIPAGPPRARWGEFARRHALPEPPFSFFPTRRFPTTDTTLRELLHSSRRGNYFTPSGEVDSERIWQMVREIVSEQAGVKVETLQRDTHFINDLNLD